MGERLFPDPQGPRPKHDIKAAYFEVEYENVFHLKELYKLIHEWFGMWGFDSINGRGQKEKLYMELVNDQGKMNHHIWWRLQRNENKYFKYFIKFDYQTLNTSKLEIMHKGKKAKTHQSDVILRCEGWVMCDYMNEWPSHWLLKHFDNWFVRRWHKQRIEQHRKELWFEVYNLEDTIKQYLQLNTPFEPPKAFHPNKGLA